MGGNAIKSAKRISKETYNTYVSEICQVFPEIKMAPTLAYRSKKDFGDIDIIVETNPIIDIKKLVFERLSPLEIHDNGPYFSFLYKDAQIDFIFATPDEFDMTWNYMNWNDIGNFFGRVARSINFKYGHDGLSFEKHLSDHYKISVLVSRDLSKILPFLGYDYNRWLRGFDTEDEIFEYAASSPLFNSLYFNLHEQNHNDRVRNRKRKMYQKMLAYIEENKITGREKLTEDERKSEYQRAITVFGSNFDEEVKLKYSKYDEHCKFKNKFNGDLVGRITGLQGKDLGAFMRHLTAFYPTLKTFVESATPIEIENWIKNCHNNI